MAEGLTFVVADDHPLFRGAIKETLLSLGVEVHIFEAGDFEATKRLVMDLADIDLVLLDLNMPGTSGLSGLVMLRAMRPSAPVIIVSASDESAIIGRAIELGASGYIKKSASLDEIRDALKQVLEGGLVTPDNVSIPVEQDAEVADLIIRLKALTPQQARVLSMIAGGLLNKQIAYELGVSEATIKAHVSAVLQKLNVDSRTQAVIRLAKIGSDQLPS